MRQLFDEFVLSMVAILAITGLYALLARQGIPSPGSRLGHGIGIVGFVLMLGAETLYSARKRIRGLNRGSMYAWLQGHVLMGLSGSYLVLLHSAGKFNGLAGVLSLLTVITVVSGFVGRYLYTEVPRTLTGAMITEQEVRRLAMRRRLFALWHVFHVPLSVALFLLAAVHIGAALYYSGS